jgi:hypothetical protein
MLLFRNISFIILNCWKKHRSYTEVLIKNASKLSTKAVCGVLEKYLFF